MSNTTTAAAAGDAGMIVKPRVVGIIGVGHVGSHVAYALAALGVADELLCADCDLDKACAQATDVEDAVTYLPHRVRATGCRVEDLARCDVIVLSAGPLPTQQQSRLDTLPATMAVVGDVLQRMRQHVMPTFKGIMLCISNPADVVAAYVQRALHLPSHRVLSTGTCLDSARLQALLAAALHHHVSPASLKSAYMLGEHGDSCFVAWSHVMVGNKPLDQLQKACPERYPAFDREALNAEVKRRAYGVMKGKGSTEFGIATAAAEIIKAIFHDEHKVLPCSVLLEGHYGEHNVYASTPAIIGARGVEEVIELQLNDDEKARMHKSCEIMRAYIDKALALCPIIH